MTVRRPEGEGDATADLAWTSSMIAHELKGPVMSIRGLASTGIRLYESLTDEERLEFFRLIDREAARLSGLAAEVSTAMKIQAGRVVYDMRPTSLGELLQEAIEESALGEHPVVLDAEDDLEVILDRVAIAQVARNLLDNAAKYSPPDAPIEVRAKRTEAAVVVEIADRGPGIPPEERKVVFERFAKLRPKGYEDVPGAGLGLFIARAHVLAHGGEIEVDQRLESGTMLRFALPTTLGSTV